MLSKRLRWIEPPFSSNVGFLLKSTLDAVRIQSNRSPIRRNGASNFEESFPRMRVKLENRKWSCVVSRISEYRSGDSHLSHYKVHLMWTLGHAGCESEIFINPHATRFRVHGKSIITPCWVSSHFSIHWSEIGRFSMDRSTSLRACPPEEIMNHK